MSSLKIVATIVAKEEGAGDVLSALHAVAEASQKEEGNISYKLHEDTENRLKFIILEEWKSQEAIDIHNKTPHFLALKKALAGKIEDLAINVIREID